jgi:TrbL/VirB6 plasmid conjugal transfer protein
VASAPDVTEQLGGTDPLCTHPAGLSPQSQRNCAASGSPQSPFPAGNYTPDTHIDTGLTDPGNDIDSAIQNVIGLMFGLFVTVIHAAMLAVSLAFGFDLFASDHSQQIPHALQSMEQVFTLPWLPVAFAIGAIVGICRWWGHRQEAAAIGHWTLMVVCAALGLLITTDPQATAGWVDAFANQAAMGTLAGASDHNPAAPASSYADATTGMWQQMVETPWCAVEFGDTQWCMSPIDKQTEQWRQDVQAHIAGADSNSDPLAPTTTSSTIAHACGNPAGQPTASASACLVAQQEALRLRDAQTNGELWLAFPSGDDARNGKNDSWTLYHHLLQDRPELAQIRGTGGVVDRLGIVALCAVGMLFFLLLLIYIAANLLLASLFFVVLLLLAPVMLLFPCFGDAGRRAFWRWLGYATGALLAKVIYALYLGVLLFASAVVGGIGVQNGGWLLEWILFAALWGLAFAYRGRMLALLSLGGHHEHHRGIEAAAATMGAVALTRATGRRVVTRPTRRLVDEHLDRRDERRYREDLRRAGHDHRALIEQRRTTERGAEDRLTERAVAMLDARHEQARATIARKAELLEQIATARRQAETHRATSSTHGQAAQAKTGKRQSVASDRASELENTLTAAERFVQGAQEHERLTGQRYTPRQLSDARAAVNRELDTPPERRDYEQLAYRLPGGRDAYQAASRHEKALMRERIDRQIADDQAAVDSAQHAADRVQTNRPVMPRQPRPRRPRAYRRYEFHGARQHMPAQRPERR